MSTQRAGRSRWTAGNSGCFGRQIAIACEDIPARRGRVRRGLGGRLVLSKRARGHQRGRSRYSQNHRLRKARIHTFPSAIMLEKHPRVFKISTCELFHPAARATESRSSKNTEPQIQHSQSTIGRIGDSTIFSMSCRMSHSSVLHRGRLLWQIHCFTSACFER